MPNQLDPETARLLALIQMQRAMGSEQPPVARPPVEQPPVSQPPFDAREYVLANPDLFPFDPRPRQSPYPYPARSNNPLLAALEIMVRPSGGYPAPAINVRPPGGYPTYTDGITDGVRPPGGYPTKAPLEIMVRPPGGYPMTQRNRTDAAGNSGMGGRNTLYTDGVRPPGGYPTTRGPAYYPSSRM
jgi:hypothetical protein